VYTELVDGKANMSVSAPVGFRCTGPCYQNPAKKACHVTSAQVGWSSQFGEDAWLYNALFHEKRNGFYVEMGAMNGVDISNTRWFQQAAGWRGLLIEACPGVSRLPCGNVG
jgi:hypothetical protein